MITADPRICPGYLKPGCSLKYTFEVLKAAHNTADKLIGSDRVDNAFKEIIKKLDNTLIEIRDLIKADNPTVHSNVHTISQLDETLEGVQEDMQRLVRETRNANSDMIIHTKQALDSIVKHIDKLYGHLKAHKNTNAGTPSYHSGNSSSEHKHKSKKHKHHHEGKAKKTTNTKLHINVDPKSQQIPTSITKPSSAVKKVEKEISSSSSEEYITPENKSSDELKKSMGSDEGSPSSNEYVAKHTAPLDRSDATNNQQDADSLVMELPIDRVALANGPLKDQLQTHDVSINALYDSLGVIETEMADTKIAIKRILDNNSNLERINEHLNSLNVTLALMGQQLTKPSDSDAEDRMLDLGGTGDPLREIDDIISRNSVSVPEGCEEVANSLLKKMNDANDTWLDFFVASTGMTAEQARNEYVEFARTNKAMAQK